MISEARASAALFEGEGTGSVLGCLTGESEERETWTAESLRAVFSHCREAAGRDFGGLTFRSTRKVTRVAWRVWTSSNVVNSRIQSLIQPESLILAQSERWRQA